MSLLNKLRKKYINPEIEIIKLTEDIMASSSPKLMEDEYETEKKKEQMKELTFFEKYPDGVPLEVLKLIDFKHFGAKLKQAQLLPPSYARNPIKVEIEDWCGYPRVFLTFKSKTSESYRIVGICRYSVAYSTKMNKPVKVLETNPLMIPIWRDFAQNVMWAWEHGYNYALVGPEKNIETYRKLMVDEYTIEIFKERERIRAGADATMRTDAEYMKMIEEFEKDNSESNQHNIN